MEEITLEKNRFNYVYIIPFIVILISSFIYFIYIGSFSGFDQTSQRFIGVLDSFKKVPINNNIFIGDSQIREDIDCISIEKNNLSCYNFAIEGILPIQLALISNEIINSNPKRVIIGVSPLFFSESINKNDNIFFFAGDKKINLDKQVIKMLNHNEVKLISMNWFKKGLYKRKFILPFYLGLIKGIFEKDNKENSNNFNNFKNPYIFNKIETNSELKKKLNNTNTIELFKFNNSKIREVDAFKYLISKLRINNIEVTIIEMPLNPIIKEYVNSGSKEEFSLFISKVSKEYNTTYIDISDYFKDDEFIDISHLNEKGRARLSEIIKTGERNVI